MAGTSFFSCIFVFACRILLSAGSNEYIYDLIVVGGGPLGLSSAYYATKYNNSVINSIAIIEQYEIGNQHGSSVGDTRQFRRPYSQPYLALLANESGVLYRELEAELESETGMQHMLLNTTNGYLFFGDPDTPSTTEGNFKQINQTCNQLNLGCQYLSHDDLTSTFPMFTNLPSNYVGIFDPQSGEINVNETIFGLKTLLQSINDIKIDFYQYTSVDSILDINASFVSLSVSDSNQNGMIFYGNKVILTTGAYLNNLTKTMGIEFNISMWEMPSFYFKILDDFNESTSNSDVDNIPTWFVFAGNTSSLYYGFPANTFFADGYVRVAPDWVTSKGLLTYPSQRRNKIDTALRDGTVDYVFNYMNSILNSTDYITGNNTCLASFVQDNGYIIDFAPSCAFEQQYEYLRKKLVIFGTGWSFKFVPIFGKFLAQLAIQGTIDNDLYNHSLFSSNRTMGVNHTSIIKQCFNFINTTNDNNNNNNNDDDDAAMAMKPHAFFAVLFLFFACIYW